MKTRKWAIAALSVVALLAWFITPVYLRAANRRRQKETMANIRAIATAWEARATDKNSYRVAPRELARSLQPTYIRVFPHRDGWNGEFQFTSTDDTYTIRSLGSDHKPDRVANLGGATTSFTDDIIYSNGSFIRYPEEAG